MNRLVRTELLKQRTTRSFLVGVAAAPAVATLVAIAVMSTAGKDGNDPLGPLSLAQVIGAPASIVTLVSLMLGLFATAGEYRHETITTTFLACPRRREVVIAKLVASALVGAVMGVLSLVVTIAISVPWLHSSGVAAHLGTNELRVGLGLVLSTALYGALGVAVGALVRNQTAASAAVLVWLLAVEGIVADVFSESAFVHWLPAAAGRALIHIGPAHGALAVPVAAGVFVAYVAVIALVAGAITLQRDIG